MVASIVFTFESRVGSAARPLGLLGSALANIGKPRNEPIATRLFACALFLPQKGDCGKTLLVYSRR